MKQQSAIDVGTSSMSGSRAKQQPGGGGGGATAAGVVAAAPTGSTLMSGGSSAAQRSGSPSSSRMSHHRGKGGNGASRSSAATAAAREEARKRMHEMRGDLEGVIHVLDGGVNRTPLPLQPRQSLVGGIPHEVQGGGGGMGASRMDGGTDLGGTTNTMNNDLGSSFMHSSFVFNMSSRSSNTRGSVANSSMYSQSRSVMEAADAGSGAKRGGGGGENGVNRSLESSIQSFSFAGDRQTSDRYSLPTDSSSMRRRSGAGGTTTGPPLPRLVQQNGLLAESIYTAPLPLSANDKAAWRKATTTIVLTETPTIFLYSHQDEIVSNEYADEVAAVTTRNRDYAVAEEMYRTDEGTRFHSTGAITMRAPMKSIQTEVHPPTKKDSGALQVTPWMLKDAYAAALAAAEDAEDDGQEEAQQQQGGEGGAGAGGEGGGGEGGAGGGGDGGDGGDVDEALRDSAELNGGGGSFDGDGQSSENGQSTMVSDTATHTMTGDVHGGGGKGGGVGGSDGRGGTAATGGGGGVGGGAGGADTSKQWMLAETLLSTLRVMERAIVQNTMEAAQLAYRGISAAPPKAPTSAPAKGGRRAGPNTAATTPALTGANGASPPPLPPAAATVHNTPLPAVGADGGAMATATDGPLSVPESKGATATAAAIESAQAASMTSTSGLAMGTLAASPVRLSDGVHLLWRFGSPHLTCNRGVTCMTWNRRESDMLAVGYTACRPSALPAATSAAGGADDETAVVLNKRAQGQEAHGMVCCWSLKNPLAPELILYLRGTADVTALAFSYEHPSLLAVGSSIGEIVVYDIQHDVVFPSIAPALVGATGGQHTGAIWELRWVPKGKEHGEFLTSISADGRVVQWAVGKSIERVPPDLMHLQRQPGTQVEKAFVAGVAEAEAAAAAALAEGAGAGKGKKGGVPLPSRPQVPKRGGSGGAGGAGGGGGGGGADEAILSRQCGGMCFDICPADTAVYIVGTEDGSVLQCSKSQTENYDFEYESHAELVYRVRWSPYSSAYFLTSSADWTSRLYKVGTAKAQLRFHSARQDAVQDVAWSYTNALVFATATAQGNAEVWTVMDNMCPRATVEYNDHRRLSAVLFAEQETPVLVVGDEEGDVMVFRLDGEAYLRRDLTDDEQEEWLAEAVRKQLM